MMRTLDRDNVIITHDSGSPREQLLPFWETTSAGSYLGWGKSTQLGYGLGITMGAKLAAPKKLCINVMGDAAIGMTGMDIETAARNRIAILTVVFNNGVMAAERDVLKLSTKKYGALTSAATTKVAEGLNVAPRASRSQRHRSGDQECVAVTETGAPFLLEFVSRKATTSRATPEAAKRNQEETMSDIRISIPPDWRGPRPYSHVAHAKSQEVVFIAGQVPVDAQAQRSARTISRRNARRFTRTSTPRCAP